MTHIINLAVESPLKNVVTTCKKIWTKCNEIALNVNTLPDIPLETLVESGRPYLKGAYSNKAKYDDNIWYESPDYWYLYKIAKMLGKNDLSSEIFCDIGSGKGRVLCVMARLNFRKVIGVELFEDLCAAASQNISKMRGQQSPVDILCEDAAKADLSQATIFFMFNPFGEDTMREVLKNIRLSQINYPRDITIIYYNAVHEPLLKANNWLEEFAHFYTATRRKVSFWRNVDGETITYQPELQGVAL